MTLKDLRQALVHELQDIYNAESQLTKALPKMVKRATDPDLAEALEQHLEETLGQVDRLKEAFEQLEVSPGRVKCNAMEGLIKEGDGVLKEEASDKVRDALLIAAAQKVEHYEIASYGTAIAWCHVLDFNDVADLLTTTLEEENSADKKLSEIAERVNKELLPA